MKYNLVKNHINIKEIPTNTNNILHNNLTPPFDTIFGTSGFCVNINGSANSGKTNLLLNLFVNNTKNKITGKKQNLKRLFHLIFIVSPNLKSLKKDIFKDIKEDFKFQDLGDFLGNFKEIINKEKEDTDEEFIETLVIFDDIGNQIRNNGNERLFSNLVCNRRHDHISIINLTQRLTQIPPIIRSNLSAMITFYLKTKTDEDYIYEEFTKFDKKYKKEFFDNVFTDKYDFLLIDLSLKNSHKFLYYKCYDLLHIED